MREQVFEIPGTGFRYNKAPKGFITVFVHQVECGLCCPLDPCEVQILNDLQISPSQLHPNGWMDVVLDALIAWNLGKHISPRVFRYLHNFSRKCAEKLYTTLQKDNYRPFFDKPEKRPD
ncbi:hypothetical protein M5689_012890 [Euphorbia peplus]|nr:hypothetical protein M5689_012890 [Euphorbia peplus]